MKKIISDSSPFVQPKSSDLGCAALDWLYSTQLFGIKLGLEGITRLLKACGVDKIPDSIQVIHVAGTNGKGSTCAMIEAVARASGYRTGIFTSPHLICFHERIRVGGIMIPQAALERLIAKLQNIIEDWEHKPTFFELVFALAMMYFVEQNCNLLILETGMGGRLDATNSIKKDVAVITDIALDHTQYLGETLTEIAGEKAGIIHHQMAVCSAAQHAEVLAVLRARCEEKAIPLSLISEPCPYPLALRGSYQSMNAALALAALESLPFWSSSETIIRKALVEVLWPGRFESVRHPQSQQRFILDGAHNPHAMRVLVKTWKEYYPQCQTSLIFAASADKQLDEMIDLLRPIVKEWILVPVDSPRILHPSKLAQLITACYKKEMPPIRVTESLEEAFEKQLSNSIDETRSEQLDCPSLVCGSFFLLGELKALWAQENYHSSAQ